MSAPASTTPATPRPPAAAPIPPTEDRPVSVFADIRQRVFRYRYDVELYVYTLVGGTPTDQNVAEGWIRTKMGLNADDLIRAQVERTMDERGVTPDQAIETVARNKHLNGFKRDPNTALSLATQRRAIADGLVFESVRKRFTPTEARATFGELYIEGRHLKAMLKEATMIGVGSEQLEGRSWGATKKALKGFLAEHVFVEEERVYLGRTEPDEIAQSFVSTFRGTGIKLEEHVEAVTVPFTIVCDYPFLEKDVDFFGKVLCIAEMNGLGSSRSQGFGRFVVTKFEDVSPVQAKRTRAKKAVVVVEDAPAAEED